MSASNFYTPASTIREVPGVKRRPVGTRKDSYTGSAEGLVATGLLTVDMLPGQPGRPVGCVTYKPHRGRYGLPGYLTVTVAGVGRYRAVLCVSLEERERREKQEAAAKARRDAEKSREQTATACAMQPELIDEVGRMFLRDSVQALGLPRVVALVDAMRGSNSGSKALASMGMFHRRKLPTGWRVIEGQRPS